jgi:cell volume regulation protein A
VELRIEYVIAAAAALLVISVLASKLSVRLGVPALLFFVFIGMLAGSEGPGGIHFDYPWTAQLIGIVALSYILFAAGFETQWEKVRPVLAKGTSLATAGVVVSTALMAVFAHFALGFPFLEGLLLGAIVSSTDAAAVFSVLRTKGLTLAEDVKSTLELESGSNDPMAVLLTLGTIQLITQPQTTAGTLLVFFALQLALGGALGLLLGKATVFAVNRSRLEWEGLYPVLSLGLVVLTYGATAALGGNGFLAVYVAGLVMGNTDFVHRRSLRQFHDGLAWLMQIAMFVVLGLQVFPSQLVPVAGLALSASMFLMFVARPASIFAALPFRDLRIRDRLFIS